MVAGTGAVGATLVVLVDFGASEVVSDFLITAMGVSSLFKVRFELDSYASTGCNRRAKLQSGCRSSTKPLFYSVFRALRVIFNTRGKAPCDFDRLKINRPWVNSLPTCRRKRGPDWTLGSSKRQQQIPLCGCQTRESRARAKYGRCFTSPTWTRRWGPGFSTPPTWTRPWGARVSTPTRRDGATAE